MKPLSLRLRRALRGRAGASLLIVLAVMMLLTSIAASAFVAASLAAGVGSNETVRGQLELYADSMQRSLMYSLQNAEKTGDINDTKTLGGQLMRILYDKASNELDQEPGDPEMITYETPFTLQLDVPALVGSPANMDQYKMNIDLKPRVKVKREYVERLISYDEEGNEVVTEIYHPREADVAASIKIHIEVNYAKKTMLSVASYEFSRSALEDNGSVAHQKGPMMIKQSGEWRFVSHEKTEKKAETTT